ncbi:MAG: DUF2726 domain-containing protein [Methylococcaceae bacterium]|nr:MAG: DUF2726 domain-containing protein [Methylococcaceae bacterium]
MKGAVSTVIALLLIAWIIVSIRNKLTSHKKETWPTYAKKLMSAPEQVLYYRLINAFPEYLVFPQVQVSRFLGIKKGHNFGKWFNRINRLSADFVICNKDSSIIAVIELDDSTHNTQERKITDAKKDNAIQAAGLRIIRLEAKQLPSESTLTKLIGKNS